MKAVEIPIGSVFGKWTVLSDGGNNNEGRKLYNCRCECGLERKVQSKYLRNGRSTQCGTCDFERLEGKRFGKLTVVSFSHKEKSLSAKNKYKIYWNCRCECGTERKAEAGHLRGGSTSHCGCAHTLHSFMGDFYGDIDTAFPFYKKLYMTWWSMNRRCTDVKHEAYKNYGGRGITVCDEWKENVKPFYDWAVQNGYQEGLSLERVDNNAGYSPSNCRWATMEEQSHNKRNNTFNEEDVKMIRELYASGVTQKQLCEAYDVGPATIHRIVMRKQWKNV